MTKASYTNTNEFQADTAIDREEQGILFALPFLSHRRSMVSDHLRISVAVCSIMFCHLFVLVQACLGGNSSDDRSATVRRLIETFKEMILCGHGFCFSLRHTQAIKPREHERKLIVPGETRDCREG